MSSYLAKSDFLTIIREADLNEILDDTDATLDQVEEESISMIKNYIGQRYDIDTELAKSGSARNQFFLSQLKKAALYNLYRRTGNNIVPEVINQDYADVMDWLEKVAKAKINLDLDILNDSDGDPISIFRYGSQDARSH